MKRALAIALIAALFWVSPLGKHHKTARAAAEAEVGAEAMVEAEEKAIAGLGPDSRLYWLERAMERLQLLVTRKAESRAELEAGLAMERAAESALMARKGRLDLAGKAAAEHAAFMASASSHLQVALEKDRGAKAAEKVAAVQKQSLVQLQTVLQKAPEEARAALEAVLARQAEQTERLTQLHSARASVLEARAEWQAARKSGTAQALAEAEARLRAAEEGWKAAKGLEKAVQEAQEELLDSTGGALDEVLGIVKGSPAEGKDKPDKAADGKGNGNGNGKEPQGKGKGK